MTSDTITTKRFLIGPLQTNCYMLIDKPTSDCLIIDPGGDAGQLTDAMSSLGLNPIGIINTHGHFDHVFSDWQLAKDYNIPVYIHADDRHMLENDDINMMTFFGLNPKTLDTDMSLTIKEVKDHDTIMLGDNAIAVMHTPGHTPGSICLMLGNRLFTGDLLFKSGVGRTDLAGGSSKQLMESLRKVFELLHEDMIVYPGHGEMTELGCEKDANPWVRLAMEQ